MGASRSMKPFLTIVLVIASLYIGLDLGIAWKNRTEFRGQVSSLLEREKDNSLAARNERASGGTNTDTQIMAFAEEHDLDLVYEDIERGFETTNITIGQTIVGREWVFTMEF